MKKKGNSTRHHCSGHATYLQNLSIVHANTGYLRRWSNLPRLAAFVFGKNFDLTGSVVCAANDNARDRQ